MTDLNADLFPLSQKKSIKGNRRLVREKVLQILTALVVSDTPSEILFPHIFYRVFNVEDEEASTSTRILTPAEVTEVEADFPIIWKQDEIDFAEKLIVCALESKKIVDECIDIAVRNWELERIATVDHILILMSVAEFINFPEIPSKVTINEAIDIAKKYSTEKSSVFINGVLDAILEILIKQGRITKQGRGLKTNSRL
ncbi:MAG: transcription antitermination factor NusB [Candidatus Kapabacteria bacterium]|nr:transcription antitermination factor NusB [Candidatus Kapabacteria bacterium]